MFYGSFAQREQQAVATVLGQEQMGSFHQNSSVLERSIKTGEGEETLPEVEEEDINDLLSSEHNSGSDKGSGWHEDP